MKHLKRTMRRALVSGRAISWEVSISENGFSSLAHCGQCNMKAEPASSGESRAEEAEASRVGDDGRKLGMGDGVGPERVLEAGSRNNVGRCLVGRRSRGLWCAREGVSSGQAQSR